MAEVDAPTPQTPDVMQLWRDWLTQTERQWNTFFQDVLGTEMFASNMNRGMEAYVGFQKLMADTSERYLGFWNIPTRNDLAGLGERLQGMEDRLTNIETMLQALATGRTDELLSVPPALRRPARTRKPPELNSQDGAGA